MPARVAKGKLALISAAPGEFSQSVADTLRTTLRGAFHLFPAIAIWLVVLIPHNAVGLTSSHQKTDIVHMKNGDKITCEIQSLQKGQLNVKPDYTTDTIVIDWTRVERLESSQLFVITDPNGKTYSGVLAEGIQPRTITIVGRQSHTLSDESVVEISELGNNFWNSLSGNIAIGTSFTASNSQGTLTVQSGLQYQSKRNIASLSSNSQFVTQEKATNTNEITVKAAFFHQISESKWYGGAIANFLSSSEQQIALQSTLGGAMARRLIFTNRTNLSTIGGLGYTHERDDSNESGTRHPNSIDAATAVQFSMFRFKTTSFNTAVWAYPSLTSPGHFRMTLNQDIYYKFKNDFYVSLSFYDNYDNQPVSGAPSNNFGTTTSIGWSFH
ncbi:DUF481 domain-containing protein [Terracidiphilus gabretensis]|uniref:DUF481 domain-containing protein n=1 Tax=Terracidiphilus gabretensis TaxID=1577687 RepID=UPI0012FABFAD|nr:DUF481 domain-containing protein [Terracidiphilus gabretensis]